MAAPLCLDHLVYAVPDLDRAIDEIEQRLGVRAAYGGKHEAFGTHNAILPLDGERYVELISLDPANPEPAQAAPFGLSKLEAARLVTWAVRSHDIEADVQRARSAGFDPGLVLDVSRKQPDGKRLQWKLTLRPKPLGDGLVPFVIDWVQSTHPTRAQTSVSGRCELVLFAAAHPDPTTIRGALHSLGVELDVAPGEAPTLRAQLKGPRGSFMLD